MSKGKTKNKKLTLERVYDINNLMLADHDARLGKSKKYGVRKFDKNRKENLLKLQQAFKNRTFKTMTPVFENRFCDKKFRVLAKVHYYYHVAHHALMNIIMPVLEKSYYYESGASIKNRGIHYMLKHVSKYIKRNKNKEIWWAQIDFIKFYHNIVRKLLYNKLCKTFTNDGIRWLFHDIIWTLGEHNGLQPSSGDIGVGIGLYPIQPLVNFYLNDLDREISKRFKVKNFRYCDNILLVSTNVKELQKSINFIIYYSDTILKQPIHKNIGIQKLNKEHPISFVGYLIYKTHILIRKETKYRFKKKARIYRKNSLKRKQMIASYKGWLKYCNGYKLFNKILYDRNINKPTSFSRKRRNTLNYCF